MSTESIAYYSYEEAKAAVRRLGIRSVLQYYCRYYQDPKLPVNPFSAYQGQGWLGSDDFLGI